MHPYKNRQTDRKLNLNKSIPTRTDTRVGNYTLTNARLWSYIMCFRARAVPRGPCCEPSLWTDGLSPSSWGHLSTSYLITEQSSTPWTLLWAHLSGQMGVTLQLRPCSTCNTLDPGVLHDTNGVPGCYATPLLSRSITQYQWCTRVLCNTLFSRSITWYQWCTRVLCNTTVFQEYYMIPMVYQGVMQHHCFPGVLHDTNGVPGCYATPLFSRSITWYQWCTRVLCNTTVFQEYYMIPMVYQGVMQHTVVQEYYMTPMVYQGVMQHHCCPGVLHDTNGVM